MSFFGALKDLIVSQALFAQQGIATELDFSNPKRDCKGVTQQYAHLAMFHRKTRCNRWRIVTTETSQPATR